MGCGMTFMKYSMFLFNFLIFLSGAALLGVGIWATVSKETFSNMISSNEAIFAAAYIIIAVGAALFLIGFIGCCGAIKENRCLLGTFFAIILLLFLVQLAGAIIAIVFRAKVENAMREDMKNYNKTDEATQIWDTLQKDLECCGIDGPGDWTKKIPPSCCAKVVSENCLMKNAYMKGCKEDISLLFWVLAGISFGILLIELLAMTFACCLYSHVGKADYS